MNKVNEAYNQVVKGYTHVGRLIERFKKSSDGMSLGILQTLESIFNGYDEEKLSATMKDYNEGKNDEYLALSEYNCCKLSIAKKLSTSINTLTLRIDNNHQDKEIYEIYFYMLTDILTDINYEVFQEFKKGEKVDINIEPSRFDLILPDNWDRKETLVMTYSTYGIQDKSTKEVIVQQSIFTETLKKFNEKECGLS